MSFKIQITREYIIKNQSNWTFEFSLRLMFHTNIFSVKTREDRILLKKNWEYKLFNQIYNLNAKVKACA